MYFRLHVHETTLSKSFEDYVKTAREDPLKIKKFNRKELQVLINALSDQTDRQLNEIVMREYCLLDDMKNAFYKWENAHVEFNKRILLY